MNEKQKNQAMVNAFGTGKPPVATMRRQGVDPNSDISALFGGMQQLRTRVHKGMSGMPLNPDGTDPGNSFDRFMRQNPHLQGETKQQQQARGQGVDPNSDINAIFSGMQQLRTKVHKGMSGMPLNPDGTDPGNSFDRFMRQNPHLQGAAQRQAQYDQQARNNLQGNLQSAVAERKALQEMQNQNPNLVTGADGYKTLFDSQGKVIGTTKPMKSSATWSQDDAINRGTASPDERRDFSNTLQNTGMSSVASEIQGPKLPANMSTLFPGKSSPPGGGQGDRVGSSNPSGEPGGETIMGQMPNVQGEGMPMGVLKAKITRQPGIQYGPRQPVQQTGWDTLFPGKQVNNQKEPNSGPQRNAMDPNEDPQLPYSSPDQIEALRKLNTRGTLPGRQPETGTGLPTAPSRFRFDMTNYFPGNDYDHLQTLFPGMSIDQILQLVENPAYANQLR